MSTVWDTIFTFLKERQQDDKLHIWFGSSDCRIENGKLEVLVDSGMEMFLSHIEKTFSSTILELAQELSLEVDLVAFSCADLAKAKAPRKAPVKKATRSASPTVTLASQAEIPLVKADEKKPAATPVRSNGRNRMKGFAGNGFSIDKRYTFDNFVVGDSNQVSYACAKTVAAAPGMSYNPFFIFGQTGLGKTHLTQAVLHHIFKENPSARVAYYSAEEFTNHFVEALKNQRMSEFRSYFRNLDILLIEDIQFLPKSRGGDSKTQEEFFHTFNALYSAGKQIVLTSDRPPSELKNLEARLVTRFEHGQTVDVLKPDLETRLAILKYKRQFLAVDIPDSVISLIAENIRSNVRKLEGALTRLTTVASLSNKGEIDIDFARNVLSNMLEEAPCVNLSSESILRVVSERFDVAIKDILGKRRTQAVVTPRQVAMFLTRKMTDESLEGIGERFHRNHATILHAVKTIDAKIDSDKQFSNLVSSIEKRLENY